MDILIENKKFKKNLFTSQIETTELIKRIQVIQIGGSMTLPRILCIILIFSSVLFAINDDSDKDRNILACYEDIEVDFENGTIVLTCKYDDSEFIEITEDHDLYINGRQIRLDRSQRRLVAEYYDRFTAVIEYAKEIGLEGAKIGIAGTKVGLKALVGVMKVLFSDYESDELEEDIEEESEDLEEMAADLEEKAEDLERLADSLEELHDEIRDEIPEIGELRWF